MLQTKENFIPAYRRLYTGFLKRNPLVTNKDLDDMDFPKRSAEAHPSTSISKKNSAANTSVSSCGGKTRAAKRPFRTDQILPHPLNGQPDYCRR
jgi:hypothetical protein